MTKGLLGGLIGLLLVLCLVSAAYSARTQPFANIGGNTRSESVGTDISISSVSVLLPQSRAVKHKLEVFNGCFRWYVFALS